MQTNDTQGSYPCGKLAYGTLMCPWHMATCFAEASRRQAQAMGKEQNYVRDIEKWEDYSVKTNLGQPRSFQSWLMGVSLHCVR